LIRLASSNPIPIPAHALQPTNHPTTQLSYKTEDVESEEARKARLDKERSAQGRTLWEQLEEQKARKKEEYDAVTKQIFGASASAFARCDVMRFLLSLCVYAC
jgi:hypothetical protein